MKLQFVTVVINLCFTILLVAGQDQTTVGTAEEETTSESDDDDLTIYSECQESNGHYVKIPGYTCCVNQTLENPYNEAEDIYEDECSEPLHKVDSDDLPTAMWRKHACIMKISGAGEKDLATYVGYMKYMTMNYTEPFKTNILKIADKCKDADKEKDEVKRIKMFHLCMYDHEKKVCHKPNTKEDENQETCRPGGFPTCCKKQLIPYPVPLVHLDTEKVNVTERLKCSQSYINRQKELDPEIKKGEEEIQNHHNYQMQGKLPDRCVAACRRRSIHFTSKEALKIDIEELKKNMFTLFSASTRKDLLVRLDKYTGIKNYHILENDNVTVSVQEAVKLMTTKNEVTQIHIYCDLQEYIINELEIAAIEDYCFDEKYATRFWEDSSSTAV